MKHTTTAILFTALLAGCGSLQGQLQNRVTCTAAKDKAIYVSEYGAVGIASTIDARDAAVICGSGVPAPAAK